MNNVIPAGPYKTCNNKIYSVNLSQQVSLYALPAARVKAYIYLKPLFETVTNITKQLQNGLEIGTRDKFATHLWQENFISSCLHNFLTIGDFPKQFSIKQGVDKMCGRPWPMPTLWRTPWLTGGQIFENINTTLLRVERVH